MAFIAEGMTVALVGAVVVIAGDQIDHCLQPGHVLGRLIVLVRICGRFRLLIVAKYAGGFLAATDHTLLGGITAIR